MDEQDVLIQRFLDQDLTPDERVQFLEQVDADPRMRRAWLNLEMVVAETERLPRIAPSPHFTTRVLAALDPESKSFLDQLVGWMTVPRTLQWNVGGAMAVAVVAILAVAGLMQWVPARLAEVPFSSPSAQPVLLESASTTYVRMVLVQPGASSVSVAGGFQRLESGPHEHEAVRRRSLDDDDSIKAGAVSVHVRDRWETMAGGSARGGRYG